MNLLALIQKKREEEKETPAEISYISSGKFSPPSHDLFLAAWVPFLKEPGGCDVYTRREYIGWLLAPSLYVLNTFSCIDERKLVRAFLSRNPECLFDLLMLGGICSDILLYVPQEYEEDFLQIIGETK